MDVGGPTDIQTSRCRPGVNIHFYICVIVLLNTARCKYTFGAQEWRTLSGMDKHINPHPPSSHHMNVKDSYESKLCKPHFPHHLLCWYQLTVLLVSWVSWAHLTHTSRLTSLHLQGKAGQYVACIAFKSQDGYRGQGVIVFRQTDSRCSSRLWKGGFCR